ncbi:glycosyltransferase [Pseudomonas inefficax]|uniref:glycosyltransferase n=1 Tax=Pseudomonas inefficax TaxID=2078786 RepID=UPI004046C9BF
MKPRCLVLLAAYNGLAFIEEQVRSILGQQGVEVSILISVDKSSDGTEAWVDVLTSAEPRVRALPHGQRFGGAGANFFRLIKEASFDDIDYVSMADQDDIWLPNKLQHACTALQQRCVDGYSSDVLAFWPNGREVVVRKSQPQVAHDYLFEAAGPGCTYVLSHALGCAIQKNLIDNGSAMSKVALHDWYIYAYSRANGFKWFIDDHVGMRYRQHENNQVGVNSGFVAFKARLGKVFNGWWLSQARVIAELVGLKHDPFVARWASLDRRALVRLAANSTSCRRRGRDKAVFSILCLVLAVGGKANG